MNVVYECIGCGWSGDKSKTVHPKHAVDEKLCPECHEVTEVLEHRSITVQSLIELVRLWMVSDCPCTCDDCTNLRNTLSGKEIAQ